MCKHEVARSIGVRFLVLHHLVDRAMVRSLSQHAAPQTSRTRSAGSVMVMLLHQVFLNTGDALATRVYHRMPPSDDSGAAGIFMMAHGGIASVNTADAARMNSIWD